MLYTICIHKFKFYINIIKNDILVLWIFILYKYIIENINVIYF